MKLPCSSSVIILIALSLSAPSLPAQAGAAAKAAGELCESILRRTSQETMKKTEMALASLGGRKGLQEALEAAQREGGDALMRQFTAQVQRHGVLALQGLKGAPAAVIRAVDEIPADLAAQALRGLAREPAAMQKLVTELGKDALEVAARHPGLAGKLGTTLGKEGLGFAGKLTTPQASILARHADDLAKLAPAERTTVLSFLKEAPAKTLAWLERHPKILVAGTTATVIVSAREEIFGTADKPGLLERATRALHSVIATPLRITLTSLGALAVLALVYKFWPRRRPASSYE